MVGTDELTSLRREATEEQLKSLGAHGYSIWFMMDWDSSQQASRIITAISRRFNTPVFNPHITLISGIEESETTIMAKMEDIAHLTRPFRISLSAPEGAENYFKTVYSDVIHDERFANLNPYARHKFGKFGTPSYLPHLSFAYGNFTHEERSLIVNEIVAPQAKKLSPVIERLELYKTEGPVSNWKKIGSVVLPTTSKVKVRA